MPENNDSAFYPSVSLGFVFTELEAFDDIDFLSFGKLRASGARTANIAGPYNTSSYFYGAGTGDGWTNGVNFPYNGETGFQVGTGLGNPDLKHETQDSWEVGADLRLFQNQLGIDFTYFENKNYFGNEIEINPIKSFSNNINFKIDDEEFKNEIKFHNKD